MTTELHDDLFTADYYAAFFISLNLPMTETGSLAPVAFLQSQPVLEHRPHCQNSLCFRRVQTHEHIPLLLIPNGGLSGGARVILGQVKQTLEGLVVGLDSQTELGAALGVLVTIVHDRVVRELAQLGECCMHLLWSTLEEAAASREEQCVSEVSEM